MKYLSPFRERRHHRKTTGFLLCVHPNFTKGTLLGVKGRYEKEHIFVLWGKIRLFLSVVCSNTIWMGLWVTQFQNLNYWPCLRHTITWIPLTHMQQKFKNCLTKCTRTVSLWGEGGQEDKSVLLLQRLGVPRRDTWTEEAVELGREAGSVWCSVGSGWCGTQQFPLECVQNGRDFRLLFFPQEGGDLLTKGSQCSSTARRCWEISWTWKEFMKKSTWRWPKAVAGPHLLQEELPSPQSYYSVCVLTVT